MTPDDPQPTSSSRSLLGLRFVAVSVIVLGGIILTQVSQIGTGAGFIVVGPRIFPSIVGGVLLGLGFLFFLRTTFLLDKDLVSDVTAEDASTHWLTAILVLVSLVVYAALLHPLGYPLATALFFPGVAHILGSSRPVRNIFIGLVLGFGIYLIFTRALGVRLPAGVLAGFL